MPRPRRATGWWTLCPSAPAGPARRPCLAGSGQGLAGLTSGDEGSVRLSAAVVRCNLADDDDAVRASARGEE